MKESFMGAFGTNGQGLLDSSNRWQFDDQRRAADALEVERQEVNELEAAKKTTFTKPEGGK
jgi:hypothetical protein